MQREHASCQRHRGRAADHRAPRHAVNQARGTTGPARRVGHAHALPLPVREERLEAAVRLLAVDDHVVGLHQRDDERPRLLQAEHAPSRATSWSRRFPGDRASRRWLPESVTARKAGRWPCSASAAENQTSFSDGDQASPSALVARTVLVPSRAASTMLPSDSSKFACGL